MTYDIYAFLMKTGVSLAVWWYFWVWVTAWKIDDRRRCETCGAVME